MGIAAEGNAGMDMAAYMELLEFYMDLVEKQDAVIYGLTGVVKRQATEIHHLRNIFGVTEIPAEVSVPAELQEELDQYEEQKTGY